MAGLILNKEKIKLNYRHIPFYLDEIELDRYGECRSCRANERATDMGVGDLNTK